MTAAEPYAAGTLGPHDREELMALVRGLCADHAPSRFALAQLREAPLDGRVFAWGLAGSEGVIVYATDGYVLGTFGSAEQARHFFGRFCWLELVWIDPQPVAELAAAGEG